MEFELTPEEKDYVNRSTKEEKQTTRIPFGLFSTKIRIGRTKVKQIAPGPKKQDSRSCSLILAYPNPNAPSTSSREVPKRIGRFP